MSSRRSGNPFRAAARIQGMSTGRLLRVLAVAAAGAAIALFTSPAALAAPAPVSVQADNFRFCAASAPTCTPLDSAYSVTVPAGTTVTWTYTDTECDLVVPCPGHNVTFKDVVGKTVKQEGAVLLTRTFTTPGTYDYFCSIHQAFGMTGTVVVQQAATGGIPPTASASASPPPKVEATSTTLPRTGRDVLPLLALASELVVAGALLVWSGRRVVLPRE